MMRMPDMLLRITLSALPVFVVRLLRDVRTTRPTPFFFPCHGYHNAPHAVHTVNQHKDCLWAKTDCRWAQCIRNAGVGQAGVGPVAFD